MMAIPPPAPPIDYPTKSSLYSKKPSSSLKGKSPENDSGTKSSSLSSLLASPYSRTSKVLRLPPVGDTDKKSIDFFPPLLARKKSSKSVASDSLTMITEPSLSLDRALKPTAETREETAMLKDQASNLYYSGPGDMKGEAYKYEGSFSKLRYPRVSLQGEYAYCLCR